MFFRAAFYAVFLSRLVGSEEQCPVAACGESRQTSERGSARAFGPGLRGDFRVPARYFFVQAVNASGSEGFNFTDSLPGNLSVNISGTRDHCSIWTQVLNRGDGLFLVRYKIFRTCHQAKIEIFYNGVPLPESPIILKGPLLHDGCNCPVDYKEWLGQLECPSVDPQILADLALFPEVDMRKALREALRRFDRPGSVSFCHYAVINNEVYRKCYGEHVGFSMFMDQILLSLARKVTLPDVELLVNLGDWPLERKNHHGFRIPFFSWCGSSETSDIVMPTYDLTESSLEAMGRVTLDILSVQGHGGPRWRDKEPLGFWRGRDSRQERLDLVALSRRHPNLLNASLTNFFFFRDKMDFYGPKATHISFFDFFKYKYQINVDGTVAAYRLPYLLAGTGLVFKQDSDYYEHFYPRLVPMKHYIPFQHDLSDLVERLIWARNNDEQAQQIVRSAQQFALDHLLPHHVFCYHGQLLQEYARRLIAKPKVWEDMEHVAQPLNDHACHCPRTSPKAASTKSKENREEL